MKLLTELCNLYDVIGGSTKENIWKKIKTEEKIHSQHKYGIYMFFTSFNLSQWKFGNFI